MTTKSNVVKSLTNFYKYVDAWATTAMYLTKKYPSFSWNDAAGNYCIGKELNLYPDFRSGYVVISDAKTTHRYAVMKTAKSLIAHIETVLAQVHHPKVKRPHQKDQSSRSR